MVVRPSVSAKSGLRRMRSLACVAAAAIAALPSPLLAQNDIVVDVALSDTPPDRLEVSGNGPAARIVEDRGSGHLLGRYPRSSIASTFENVTLVGWWGNQDDRLLFLRIASTTGRLNLHLWRPNYATCSRELIAPHQRETTDRDAALQAYYHAKALFSLNNQSRCRGVRRSNAARAWLDRSFDLAEIDCAFRLSPDAALANREFDPAHVASVSLRARAREIRCINLTKSQLWQQRDLRSALSINLALIRALENDRALQALADRLYGISIPLLQRDGARLEERLGQAPAASRPGTLQPAALNLSGVGAN
jgi:hypothetical protein